MASEGAIGTDGSTSRSAIRVMVFLFLLFLSGPPDADASLLSPEVEDKLATVLAIFILIIVPIVLIVLFWMVHILPEKIAHKRHHPQFEAIRTLCLLSLVFGGLLWPLAWLWAYSKPVLYKMAYGTDIHPGALEPRFGDAAAGRLNGSPLSDRLTRLEGRIPASELNALRAELDVLEAKILDTESR
jgi:hypothetical protein